MTTTHYERLWFIIPWLIVGTARFVWYMITSRNKHFWDNFSAREREFFQSTMWVWDGLSCLVSLVAGPIYLVLDVVRLVRSRST